MISIVSFNIVFGNIVIILTYCSILCLDIFISYTLNFTQILIVFRLDFFVNSFIP